MFTKATFVSHLITQKAFPSACLIVDVLTCSDLSFGSWSNTFYIVYINSQNSKLDKRRTR